MFFFLNQWQFLSKKFIKPEDNTKCSEKKSSFIDRVKFRVGYTGLGGGFLTHRLKDDRAKRIRHEVESALEVVQDVGCKTEGKKLEISITDNGEKSADKFFLENNLDGVVVAIHPGAG